MALAEEVLGQILRRVAFDQRLNANSAMTEGGRAFREPIVDRKRSRLIKNSRVLIVPNLKAKALFRLGKAGLAMESSVVRGWPG
jgi:hypothetical protein